jgi:hypothetical protein
LGDAEVEDEMACSDARPAGLRAEAAEEGGGITRDSAEVPVERRAEVVRGDTPRGVSTKAGDAESGGALKAWKEMEGRRGELDKLSVAI